MERGTNFARLTYYAQKGAFMNKTLDFIDILESQNLSSIVTKFPNVMSLLCIVLRFNHS